MIKTAKLLLGLLIAFSFSACQSSDKAEYNEQEAQQMYDDLKGTYVGNILVDNIPQQIRITIGNDLSIKSFPLRPILRRIFTDEKQYEEADASITGYTFTTPINSMAIASGSAILQMDPADVMFTVKVEGKNYQVVAQLESRAYVNRTYDNLSLEMNAIELYCDGVAYDVIQNGVTYIIDNAKKEEQQ